MQELRFHHVFFLCFFCSLLFAEVTLCRGYAAKFMPGDEGDESHEGNGEIWGDAAVADYDFQLQLAKFEVLNLNSRKFSF